MRVSKSFIVVALIVAVSLVAVGCTTQDETVEIGYVNWACATASSYLAKNIIEIELGMEVVLTDLEAGMMWEGVSSGELDFIVCAWLPGTHAEYMERYGDSVVDVGANYEGALIGLVVPTYVNIDSIEEMVDHLDAFDGRIVGIDSGAGVMTAADRAITEYDLGMELLESNDALMTIELRNAIQNQEWIAVTGWAPHWKFAEWDLKFLEDPKGVFGGAETINTITREEFSTDNPTVQAFLDNYFLTADELGGIIAMMEEYDDQDEAAQAWIQQNQAVVDGWLGR